MPLDLGRRVTGKYADEFSGNKKPHQPKDWH
jgi:hypothetical protein